MKKNKQSNARTITYFMFSTTITTTTETIICPVIVPPYCQCVLMIVFRCITSRVYFLACLYLCITFFHNCYWLCLYHTVRIYFFRCYECILSLFKSVAQIIVTMFQCWTSLLLGCERNHCWNFVIGLHLDFFIFLLHG